MSDEKSFGQKIAACRKEKRWTAKEFIGKLNCRFTPTYLHHIEVQGHIPYPELICTIAEVLDLDRDELLDLAKQIKVQQYKTKLDIRYAVAVARHCILEKK